jgi:hypothetical protein
MSAFFQSPAADDLSEAWIDGDETARWRSTTVHGPSTGATASGSSSPDVTTTYEADVQPAGDRERSPVA